MNIEFLYKNEFLSNSVNLLDRSAVAEIFNYSAEYWSKYLTLKGEKTDKEYICEIFMDYDISANMFKKNLKLYLYSTPVAEIPIIEIEDGEDFALLIKKLVFKERPVPQSMGAAIIKNYKKNSINHSIIVLSKKYYSGIEPEMLGLNEEVWREKSFELRREHEISHFMTQYFYGISKQAVHDEIIADFMGLTAAFGEYYPEYFLAFMGLENYPDYRSGGRLENYLSDIYLNKTSKTKDSEKIFLYLCKTIKAAADNIALLYERLNKDRQKVFRVLCETTVADMAAGKFADIIKIEFEEFYQTYFSKIYNYIYYCVPNVATANDLTSDTFYKAYLYFNRYDANLGSRYTWLCAIARNVVNDYFRQSKKVIFAELDEDIASEISTETKVEERVLIRELESIVFKLPKKHRELIAMKYTLDKTNREIAKEMGMSESNVGTTLNRIIEKIRKELKNYV